MKLMGALDDVVLLKSSSSEDTHNVGSYGGKYREFTSMGTKKEM